MKPEHYERSAAAYDFFNQPTLQSPRIKAILEHTARLLPPGADVCDVGGGTGIHAGRLLALRPDVTITLVEPSGPMLDIARRRLGSRVKFVPAAIEDALARVGDQDAFIFLRSLYALADTVGDYERLIGLVASKLRANGLLGVYDAREPVDVDVARARLVDTCDKLGLRQEFERHWPTFAEYLCEFNRLLGAKGIGILDHRQLDALLLRRGFRKIYLGPTVSLHRKTAAPSKVRVGRDIRPFTCLRDGDDHYLLNTDLSAVFGISSALARTLEGWGDDTGQIVTEPRLKSALTQLELIRDDGCPPPEKISDFGVSHLMLNVCQVCNLACVYCYGEGGEYGNRSRMTKETARAAVDWLIRNSGDIETIRVTFFGGEPLLEFDLVRFVIEYGGPEAERHGKRLIFSLTTNGTLLTEDVTRYLRANDVQLMISYDGQLQDLQRPYKSGAGSSAKVLAAITAVARLYDGDFSLASTIASPDIDIASVRRSLRDLGCHRIRIRPASPLFGACDPGCAIETTCAGDPSPSGALSGLFNADLEQQYEENLRAIRERGAVVGREFRKILSILLFRGKLTHFCGAGRGLLACAANADLYPCHRFNGLDDYRLGSLASYDPRARDWFLETTVDATPACRECWARYLCGGGCLYDNLNNPQRAPQPPGHLCEWYRNNAMMVIRLFARLNADDMTYLRTELGPPHVDEPAWW